MRCAVLILLALISIDIPTVSGGTSTAKPFLPIGVFIAPIEEGGRIFTPVRFFPLEHPESAGHQFPNALQLRGTELDALVLLGDHAGLGLWATLRRYPQQPDPKWPYVEFTEPPVEALRHAIVVHREASAAPLPGLRAAAFYRGALVAFIEDTRGWSLKERGMTEPTTMGLDMSRASFLEGIHRARPPEAEKDAIIVVYAKRPCGGGAAEQADAADEAHGGW